jgi:hypothetical protein
LIHASTLITTGIFGGAARYLEHAAMLLSSMSALMRIPDSSQTSRHVSKVPNPEVEDAISQTKSRPKAALKFRPDDCDQAAINAGFDLQR